MSTATELLRRVLEEWDEDEDGSLTRALVADIRAFLAAEPEAEPVACKKCNGTGFIKTGEIDCYPDGTPYMNGPVVCVEDCPDCHPPRPEPARTPMTEEEMRKGSGEWAHLHNIFEEGVRFAEKHHEIGGGDD